MTEKKWLTRKEKYPLRDFIEGLARTELVKVWIPYTDDAMWFCPRCGGPGVCSKESTTFTHEDCIVVKTRQLLGLPTDERGNLVEEER